MTSTSPESRRLSSAQPEPPNTHRPLATNKIETGRSQASALSGRFRGDKAAAAYFFGSCVILVCATEAFDGFGGDWTVLHSTQRRRIFESCSNKFRVELRWDPSSTARACNKYLDSPPLPKSQTSRQTNLPSHKYSKQAFGRRFQRHHYHGSHIVRIAFPNCIFVQTPAHS